jgi:transposase
MNTCELKPNLKYVQECIPEIHNYLKNNYDIISVDTGYKNLLLLKNYNRTSMRYTHIQYQTESKIKKHKKILYELDHKNILTKKEQLSYCNINKYILFNQTNSLDNLCKNIKKKFGNVVLCIGDTGYNPLNLFIVEYLSKHIPCYLVDETNTSRLCCSCNSKLVYVQKNKTEIRSPRLVICSKCNTIFNKDSNACTNILNKAIKILNVILVEN